MNDQIHSVVYIFSHENIQKRGLAHLEMSRFGAEQVVPEICSLIQPS